MHTRLMHPRLRMIAASTAVALITGAASAAAASSGSSPSPSASSSGPVAKPSPTGSGTPGKPANWLNQLAASLHVDPQGLIAALTDAKQTMGQLGVGPTDARVVAVVAHDLGVSTHKATTVLTDVFGANGPGNPGVKSPGPSDPQIVTALAGILHVSQARAAQVFDQLKHIQDGPRGQGIDPNDPRFRAIAASLHITTQQLSQDLMTLKQELRASMPTSTASPKS
ncbi:hypothetical protein [Actinocrinis sp.]|uniref:hypothetical protein n=1 Tax=Actinocrinis sp. TaxID=1920516 RepID=UPI002D6AC34C|nr:hypothetical protein [Actinocrinis sp.]HZP53899.1 hypothetical protein [Actinocrinis sp.]